MENFKKEYPYADFSKFYVDVDDHGNIGVFTNAGNLGMVKYNDPKFLKSKYSKWLTANKPKTAEEEIKAFYGSNYDKAVKNNKKAIENAKRDFLNKYPRADMSKFDFSPSLSKSGDIIKTDIYFKINDTDSYDITSDTFKNNKDWVKYLKSDKIWPILWNNKGTVQDYNPKNIGFPITSFKIYIDKTQYFLSNFPKLTITNYEDSLYAAYIATYLCGISNLHFKENKDTPSIITSIARYHLYYQMRKFLRYPTLMNSYLTNPIKKLIKEKTPRSYEMQRKKFERTSMSPEYWKSRHSWQYINVRAARNASGQYVGVYYDYIVKSNIHDLENDYKLFIANDSNGLTSLGAELLQQSIESYVYSILGAQAKTRWSITGDGAKSSQTQNVFRKIVEDTITQADDTVTISNMRTVIQATNVILNMSITPGVLLIPSSMIIQKNPIPGYNNVLTIATSDMTFGSNIKVNYVDIDSKIVKKHNKESPKKEHPSNKPPKERHSSPINNIDKESRNEENENKKENYSYEIELAAILLLTSIPTYFILKHI